MDIKVQLAQTIPVGESFALLVRSGTRITTSLLSRKEKEYVKSVLDRDKTKDFISIQRLEQHIMIMFIKDDEISARLEQCRKFGSKLADHYGGSGIPVVYFAVAGTGYREMNALMEGFLLAGYRFRRYFSPRKREKEAFSVREICLVHPQPDVLLLGRTLIGVKYTFLARDLVNEPGSAFTPEKFAASLAEQAAVAGIRAEVFSKAKIEALKMGGLLAVNRGSIDPPTFTILEWNPADAVNKKPLVLVGKGVLFDTGGMNLKTGNFMDGMKSDMAGAATMAAVIMAVAEMKIPVRIIALIPATDNRVDGNALLPGDVITMHDGTTVEVKNTDAEGRLILADAISYAKRYDPDLIVDAATLTGSAMRAIGHYGIVGMHQDADNWMAMLKQAGEDCYERIAEFPMWKEYEEGLNSDIADLSNLGGVNGGAIVAGKFLAHFSEFPFIHLDIAGPAFLDKRESYITKGGSGTGVRLLLHFVFHYLNSISAKAIKNKSTL